MLVRCTYDDGRGFKRDRAASNDIKNCILLSVVFILSKRQTKETKKQLILKILKTLNSIFSKVKNFEIDPYCSHQVLFPDPFCSQQILASDPYCTKQTTSSLRL